MKDNFILYLYILSTLVPDSGLTTMETTESEYLGTLAIF